MVEKLIATPGFEALNGREAARLVTLVSGPNTLFGEPSRKSLAALLASPTFSAAPPPKQAQALRGFVSAEQYLPEVLSAPFGRFEGRRAVYSITETNEVASGQFHTDSTQTARKAVVTVNGHSVAVWLPETPDPTMHYHSLRAIARGLSSMPPQGLKLVERVKVEPKTNPDDKEQAEAYHDPGLRSFMIAENGTVWMYPDADSASSQERIDGTLVHESGHLLSWAAWGRSTDDPGWNRWKLAMKSDHFHASKYAKDAVAEDFGETFQLYDMVVGTAEEASVRALMPGRFKLIDELLRGTKK